jgi:hypothetical protein
VLLDTPGALLSRSHLHELGLERRAVDAVFGALDVVVLAGYSQPRFAPSLEVVLVLRRDEQNGRPDEEQERPPAERGRNLNELGGHARGDEGRDDDGCQEHEP